MNENICVVKVVSYIRDIGESTQGKLRQRKILGVSNYMLSSNCEMYYSITYTLTITSIADPQENYVCTVCQICNELGFRLLTCLIR